MKRIGAILIVVGIVLGLPGLTGTAQATGNHGSTAKVDAEVDVCGHVTVESTKDLSRVTVVYVDAEGVVKVFVNPDAPGKEWSTEVDGEVLAVFVHSGNNTTAAAEALLALLAGEDAVKGNSTGAIAFNSEKDEYVDSDECETPEEPTTTTTTAPPVTTTTTAPPVTTTTVPAPPVTTTTVPEVTTTTVPVNPDTPVVTVPPVTDTPAPVAENPVPVVNPGVTELPHTGSGWGILAVIGAGLGLTGLLLLLLGELAKRKQSN